ncbi:hypothetical protein A7D23_01960 [Dehalobacter sp. TeCB1]|uniref:Uncharacterized protein n=1 Tax=Dehalobacter restrictus (strain DSM 9455 / PER-K23) TaxID=871738 RepID=A0ABM5P9P9_DEHRP|nr:hypothetical protein DEHRE_13590 [Dehalobacter restrictus DSM 9455]OCZ49620.1 hypothetical protein A7D23_01960 [Dehalobacter sp. TeCB1]
MITFSENTHISPLGHSYCYWYYFTSFHLDKKVYLLKSGKMSVSMKKMSRINENRNIEENVEFYS